MTLWFWKQVPASIGRDSLGCTDYCVAWEAEVRLSDAGGDCQELSGPGPLDCLCPHHLFGDNSIVDYVKMLYGAHLGVYKC